jgi:hypothetical protein
MKSLKNRHVPVQVQVLPVPVPVPVLISSSSNQFQFFGTGAWLPKRVFLAFHMGKPEKPFFGLFIKLM